MTGSSGGKCCHLSQVSGDRMQGEYLKTHVHTWNFCWLRETSSFALSVLCFKLSPTLWVLALSTNLHHCMKKQHKIFSFRLPGDTKTLALTWQNYCTVPTAWPFVFMKGVAEMILCTLLVFYIQKFMSLLKYPNSSSFLLNSNLPDVYYDSYTKGYLTLMPFL